MSKSTEADLAAIYGDVAKYEHPDRDPVIVIPGILGSRLVHEPSGKVVWGAFTREGIDPKVAEEARMLAIPMKRGVPLSQLRDETIPDGALETLAVELFPGVKIEAQAYAQILGVLGAGGYRDSAFGDAGVIDYGDDHYTCFQFDYDWRRSLAENAVKLADFVDEVREYVANENLKRHGTRGDFEIDIVAHSLGTLVTRYYLMYGRQSVANGPPQLNWAGAPGIDDVIFIAPPNAGSIYALEQATKGLQYSPILPKYEPALLSTVPSVFELLPRTRHGVYRSEEGEPMDILSLDTWIENEWGLANPKQDRVLQQLLPDVGSASERREIALDHLSKNLENARRVQAALDRPAEPPSSLSMSLWIGDAVDTPAVAKEDGKGGIEFIEEWPGDGLVARYSALMDERAGSTEQAQPLKTPIQWNHVTFLPASHLELTKRSEFADSVLFQLLETD